MQRSVPRHLAPSERARSHARDRRVVESVLALVAIGLAAAILVGTLLDRPDSSAARLPHLLPPAPTTTGADATVPAPGSSQAAPDPGGDLAADPAAEASGTRSASRLLAAAAALAIGLALGARALGRGRAPDDGPG
jgi:uncharacterized SAM-binding protein YcdF (DUF218 family)